MLAMAARGDAREGDWLIAERQTAGRGRMGRDWESPTGNIYASTVIEIRPGDPLAPTLSLVCGFALWCSVRGPSELKWPNDLIIRGAKVAGILLERHEAFVVAGFGINVGHAPTDLDRPVTSVLEHNYVPQTRESIFADLVTYVARLIDDWRTRGVPYICGLWTTEAHPLGTPLRVTLPDASMMEGRFEGLSDDGALRLGLADGTVRVIHAGDVFLI